MEVKRIIQDANIDTFFRSHEWDIVKRVWNYSHLKYSSCLLKSTSISKCTKTVLFWNQPWLQGLIHDFPLRSSLSPKLSELYFEIKVDFMSTLKYRSTPWVALKSRLSPKSVRTGFFYLLLKMLFYDMDKLSDEIKLR